jgi:hypothetical protein
MQAIMMKPLWSKYHKEVNEAIGDFTAAFCLFECIKHAEKIADASLIECFPIAMLKK